MSAGFNWDHLRSLLAVARQGSLSAAARTLGVEHSTISRHIGTLEQHGGARLVERRSDGVRLTAAGERLLAAAEDIESRLYSAREEIGEGDLRISGAVRIGAPDGVGSFFLAPRLAGLGKAHPDLVIQLVAMPRVFNLSKREADLAIVLSVPEHGRVVTRKLADYGLGLYASASYLGESAPISTVGDLASHRFINYIDDLIYTPQLDYLDEVVRGARANFHSSNIIAQVNATIAGYGLCVLPHFLARRFAELEPVLPEVVRLKRTWWLLIHEDQKDLARVRLVVDFLVREFSGSAPVLLP
jgi:molybdate transport repressor ModE-like protein